MTREDTAAFPTGTGFTPYQTGMTLRDYFAAKAMQAMLGWDDERINWPSYAKQAYEMADAMLKARKT